MPVYQWKGIDRQGKPTRGSRDAENGRALRLQLKRDGVMVTELVESKMARSQGSREIRLDRFFKRVSQSDVGFMTRQLATLLEAGIPLVEALQALMDQAEQEEFKEILTDIRDKVNEGSPLADALRSHKKAFSPLYINMVTAGEASGNLEAVLKRLSDFMENQAKLKGKVSGALAYPLFMIVLMSGIVGLLMVVVVPQVTSVFEDFGQALPWYTQLLIATSSFLGSFWWLVLLLIGATYYGWRRWVGTTAGRMKWDTMMLTVPMLGSLFMMVAVARFARTLSTLLASGVPVLQAMDITRNVLGNAELMRVVEDARNSLREGESIATPLRRSGVFPPIVTHMIAIGERSGQLEEMLEHVAAAYDLQVETKLTAVTGLLEPLAIVIMGGLTGGIAFSIVMPLMQINQFAG